MIGRKILLIAGVVGVLALCGAAWADDLYVPSIEYPTIQAAIDDANDGDVVVVADGDYTGEGNKNIDFGGRAITVRSLNGPEFTIIDCENDGRAFYFHSGEDGNSVLSGLTITNGYVDFGYGGGMSIADGSSPTVTNCTFSGNDGYVGGGMYIADGTSTVTVTNCAFSGNSAENGGGGMYLAGTSTVTVTNCTFSGNHADYAIGGGIYCNGNSPTIINCTFSGNYGYRGAGMWIGGTSTVTVTNCAFSGNDGYYGGGMHLAGTSTVTVTNCAFSGNYAQGKGGGMCLQGSNTTLMNCIFWGDTSYEIALRRDNPGILTVNYSNIEGGLAGVYVENDHTINWGPDNIDTNPCFADPDYHLKSQAGRWNPDTESWIIDANTSPCIDAGDPNTSIGWEPYPNGGIVNMGAYGGTEYASKSYFGAPVCDKPIAGDINGDCKVDFFDLSIMGFHWLEDNNQ